MRTEIPKEISGLVRPMIEVPSIIERRIMENLICFDKDSGEFHLKFAESHNRWFTQFKDYFTENWVPNSDVVVRDVLIDFERLYSNLLAQSPIEDFEYLQLVAYSFDISPDFLPVSRQSRTNALNSLETVLEPPKPLSVQ
jgi:hypothetical protein